MQETMLQEVMAAPREIRFDRVPVPTAGPGQVLVKIKRIGICGSDIHVYHGKHPYTKYPVTQGHEVSGQVAALGEGVTQFQVGQRVTIEPQVYCGECYPCTHGKYNLCENLKVMGFQTTGTASEYFAVDASKVTALPAGMSYDEGAMLEPLAVTVHAARRAGDVAGKKVCVLGCGPIGILLVQSEGLWRGRGHGHRYLRLSAGAGPHLRSGLRCQHQNPPLWRGSDGVLRPRQGGHHLRLRGQ